MDIPAQGTVKAHSAIAALLDERGDDKSICPSEAARVLAGPDGDWRKCMGAVHDAVDAMLHDGRIALSWKGQKMDRRRGAYRIARRRPLE